MAHTSTREGQQTEQLTEEQWQDLMRSLIEDVNAPGDEESADSLLLEVAGREDAIDGRGDAESCQ